MKNSIDIFGDALLKKIQGNSELIIDVISDGFDNDEISVDYLFRGFDEMPELEQAALRLSKGKILDVGACAGSHSLWLQENNQTVGAIDISAGAVEVVKNRGVLNAKVIDFFSLKEEKYDTLLFLMNGVGIAGKLDRLDAFFQQAKSLLNPKGQILLDSSDIIYLFDEVDLNGVYYGELKYQIGFEGEVSSVFDWLFIGYELLEEFAVCNGFSCEKIVDGEHFDYLAQLKLKE